MKYTGWCQNDFNVRAYHRLEEVHREQEPEHRPTLAAARLPRPRCAGCGGAVGAASDGSHVLHALWRAAGGLGGGQTNCTPSGRKGYVYTA